MTYAQGPGPHFEPSSAVPSEEANANKYARWSMYLGFGSLLFTCFSGVPAIVLGSIALKKASRAKRTEAIVGIGIGSLASLGVAVAIVAVAALPNTPKPTSTNGAATSAAPTSIANDPSSTSPATPGSSAAVEQPASKSAKSPLEELALNATR